MKIEKVGIVGAGAMGILIGKKLSDSLGKDNVVFIADPQRCSKYRQHGFSSNGEECDFSYGSEPVDGPLDLILFAVKIYDLEKTLSLVKPFVAETTVLMSVMNGISSEAIIGGAFGADQVIYAVAVSMDATKVGNRLSYTSPGLLRIGEADGTVTDRIRAIAALLDQAGLKYEIRSDIKHDLWTKLMLNTGVNQTLAVLGGSFATIQQDLHHSRKLMRAAMEEVRTVAEPEGVTITEADIVTGFKIIDGLGADNQPSMLQDVEAGRETEVELFAGTIKGLGKKHNIPTPVNDWLYDEIKYKAGKPVPKL